MNIVFQLKTGLDVKKTRRLFIVFLIIALFFSISSDQLGSQLYFSSPSIETSSLAPDEPAKDLLPGKVMGAYTEAGKASIVNPYRAYSYTQMIKDAEALQKSYPDIVQLGTLGNSSDGRNILLVILGKGPKKITLNGSHHAREYLSTTLLMKMIEEYAYSYKKNIPFKGFDVKNILDQVSLYFVPMVNPDGVSLVQQGPEVLKNSTAVKKINKNRKNYSSWKANARGVDLNYQYPYLWEKIKKLKGPAPEGFKGYSPETESETKAMMDFTLNNPFLIHAAYHTQGEIIYWYNGQTGSFLNQCSRIGKNLAGLSGYRLLSKAEQERSYGGYKDWTVTTFKKPGFTIELCPYIGSFPYPDSRFNDAWNKADATGILLAKEAADMNGYEYEVYKSNSLVQLFNNKDDAVKFAKYYAMDLVKCTNKELWKR